MQSLSHRLRWGLRLAQQQQNRRLFTSTASTTNEDLDAQTILNMSITQECCRPSSASLAEHLDHGNLTSTQVTQICLDRIHSTSGLNAFVAVDREYALKMAMLSDERRAQGRSLGVLDGIPLAVKDNFVMRADPNVDPASEPWELVPPVISGSSAEDPYTTPHTSMHPSTACSRMLRNFFSPYESTVTRRLHEAGAVILGKTNMDEFGMGSTGLHSAFGPAVNPWSFRTERGYDPHTLHTAGAHPLLSAGGSSSGSAAAVAARCCFGAIGSDTGGSVRLPASYCGVVGFKPTYGRVSRFGLVAYCSSLDTPGVFARSVLDSSILTSVIASHCEFDSMSSEFPQAGPIRPSQHGVRLPPALQRLLDTFKPPATATASAASSLPTANNSEGHPDRLRALVQGLTVGIPRQYSVEELSSDVRKEWIRAAETLQQAGAHVVMVDLPTTQQALPAYYIIVTAEASSNLARYDGVRYGLNNWDPAKHTANSGPSLHELFAQNRSAGFGDEVKRRILLGNWVLSSGTYQVYVEKAQRIRRQVMEDFDSVFASGVDVLLTPTAANPAPTIESAKRASSENPVSEYLNDVMTVPSNLAGLPALSVPWALSEAEGLPIGMQLIAAQAEENKMLRIAEALQITAPFQPLQLL